MDLDKLKPEVRDAVGRMDQARAAGDIGEPFYARHEDYDTIRAELMRLADENAGLRDRESKLWSSVDNAQLRAFIEKHGIPHPLFERAEKAESELAALKRRIADAPGATIEQYYASLTLEPFEKGAWNLRGKRVRLLLDDFGE